MNNDIVFSPTRRMNLGEKHIARRRANKGDGIPLYIKGVDYDGRKKFECFIPAARGDMTSIVARPSNGKTGFMVRWARARAKWLVENGYENRVVVYVTTETSVENLHTFCVVADAREQKRFDKSAMDLALGDITDGEWEEFQRINADSVLSPLWMIGHSLERHAKRPDLFPEVIIGGLQEIQEWNQDKTEIDMIFFDYVQRFPVKGMDLRQAYMGYMDAFKNIALQFNTHSVVGVQAKREVEAKKWPIPLMCDGAETANIEQSSQNVFSLVRPRMYFQEGETFGDKNPVIVKKNSLLLTCLKQTNGDPNWHKWLEFEPEYNRLDALEEKEFKFNPPYKDE